MTQRRLTTLLAQLVLLTGCAGVATHPTAPAPATEAHAAAKGPGSGGDGGTQGSTQGSGAAITGNPLNHTQPYPDTDGDPNNHKVVIEMNVSEQPLQIIQGQPTKMLVFNGQYPGPTIKANIGDEVVVNVHNTHTEPIAIHFHGMVIEPEHDGGPWNVISAGESHTYRWIAKKEYPMSGWYHAHPHAMTHIEVPRGMAGTIQIDDLDDHRLDAYGNDWLLLSDQKFDRNNQIPPDTEFDRFNGREGDHVFVNGQEQPVFSMRPGEIHRFRVLDGGPARFYRLAAPGMGMTLIGTDGGLIEHPVPLQEQVMGVAERYEFLLTAPQTPGTYKLKSLQYDRGLGLREKFDRDLMTIVVSGPPMVPAPVPQTFRTIAPLDLTNARHRDFELGTVSAGQGMTHFVINDKSFDPLRIDNVAHLGDTEIYTIDNKRGNWDHPMHLHSVQFQVLDVDGKPPAFRSWKDVMVAPRSSVIRFAVRYAKDEFPGIFMFHCHILQHEDDGMMTHIMVNPLDDAQP